MNGHAAIRAWIDERGDEMASLLMDLVSIDTENPPGHGLGRCGVVLHQACQRLGFRSELIELPPQGELEQPCIIRAEIGRGPRTVYFHGHFDVVPAQERSQFDPVRRDDMVFGRGTADMKGGLVSMMYGAAAAKELGLLGEGRVVLHFVCDEETGSLAGSGYLRDHGLIDPSALAMLTAEPTGGVVWHANRGAITMRVNVRGKPAHVGQVHLGVNAFEHMLRVAEPLVDLSHELLQRRTDFPLEGEEARGSMLVVGGSSGSGVNFNVVPGSAWFSLDRRFNPEEGLEAEVTRLQETIDTAAARVGAQVSVEVLQRQPSSATDATHPAAIALGRCIEEVVGRAPKFELCPGVLEIRWYAQLGVPAFAYGGGRLDVSHGPDEYIDEHAMRTCATVYAHVANRLLERGREGVAERTSPNSPIQLE